MPQYQQLSESEVSIMLIHYTEINQELYDKHLCNQSGHYGKYDWCRAHQLSSEHSLWFIVN